MLFYEMSIKLSPRLRKVAELVPSGASVIDVGTDHAMVPVWLAQEKLARHVWASDLRPGPLRSAAALIEETETGGTVELCLTDGLNGFDPSDGDTVIIAGMGGETMISILEAAERFWDGSLFILQPQTKQAELRRWLAENGFSVQSEHLVRDSGRIYPVFTAIRGEPAACTEGELYTGRLGQIGSSPLFTEYLDSLIKRAEAAAPYDEKAAALLAEFRSMKERA